MTIAEFIFNEESFDESLPVVLVELDM